MCALCNAAHLAWSAEAADGRGAFEPTGEPTEAALRSLAEKIGAPGVPASDREAPERASEWWAARFPRLATLEFSRDRKSMSVLCATSAKGGTPTKMSPGVSERSSQHTSLFVKGKPEMPL